MDNVTKAVVIACMAMALVLLIASMVTMNVIVAIWACFMVLVGIWFSLE